MPESSKKKNKYDEWEVNNAVETLLRAEEIKINPELMKLCEVEIKKKQKALDKLTGDEILKMSKENPDKFKNWAKSK